ncbi:MAG: DMT family transporter [Anaerolineae bacterium]|nr:DMT family transporter [Anaerolineae bacterium]
MRRWIADIALALVALIWGSTFVLVKSSLSDVGPLVFVAGRFWVGALALAPFVLHRRAWLTSQLIREASLTGALLALGYTTQTVGLQTTEAGKAAFITGLSVVLVPIFAGVWLRQSPGGSAWLGVCLAAGGLALMTLDRAVALVPGDFWVLACAFGFALQITATARFAPSHAVLAFALVQLVAAAMLTTLAALGVEREALAPPPSVWPALLYMGVAATALVFGLQTWAQRHTDPTHTALIFALEPVFGAVFAVIFAREVLSLREWAGGALILLGMLAAELGAGRVPHRDIPVAGRWSD